MGRENKLKRFEMRLTDSEKERLKTYADMINDTPSSYVRMLIWGLHPAKLPLKQYEDISKRLVQLDKDIRALTAEIKLTGEVPGEEIEQTISQINKVNDEVRMAIRHPLETIDPKRVKSDLYRKARGKGLDE